MTDYKLEQAAHNHGLEEGRVLGYQEGAEDTTIIHNRAFAQTVEKHRLPPDMAAMFVNDYVMFVQENKRSLDIAKQAGEML